MSREAAALCCSHVLQHRHVQSQVNDQLIKRVIPPAAVAVAWVRKLPGRCTLAVARSSGRGGHDSLLIITGSETIVGFQSIAKESTALGRGKSGTSSGL